MEKLSSEGAMVLLLDFRSKGQGHLFIVMELSNGHRSSSSRRGNLICITVCTWSMRFLSATGSTDTSAADLMTSFQSLSSSHGSGISARDRFCACTVRPWVATRQRALTPGAPL
jgi:hypothetical protein